MSGALMGFVLSPRRAIEAWRASRGGESLFPLCTLEKGAFEARYDELLSERVGDLRRHLGVAEGGIALHPRKLHAYAPV